VLLFSIFHCWEKLLAAVIANCFGLLLLTLAASSSSGVENGKDRLCEFELLLLLFSFP